MALQANALTTLNMAKTYLKIPLAETSQDTLLEMFINASSDALESECDRKLKKVTGLVEYQDGRGQNIITPREWPIVNIQELRVDNKSDFTDASTIVDPADYGITDFDMSIVYENQQFPKGYKNIKIIYDAGYDPLPADIEHACLWLVFWYNSIRNAADIGRESKSKEGESISYSQSMPQDVRDCILRYKRTDFFANNASVRNV